MVAKIEPAKSSPSKDPVDFDAFSGVHTKPGASASREELRGKLLEEMREEDSAAKASNKPKPDSAAKPQNDHETSDDEDDESDFAYGSDDSDFAFADDF